MAIDIQFDESQADANTQMILNASTNAESKVVHQSYKVIVNTANQLIMALQQMRAALGDYEDLLKHAIKQWESFKKSCQGTAEESKISTLYKQYVAYRKKLSNQYFNASIKQKVEETYALAMKFQEYINAALGQEVATVYVWVGKGGVPQTYIIHDMSDFLYAGVDSSGKVIVRYRNNVTNLRRHAQKVENAFAKEARNSEQFNFNLLLETYQTVRDRFRKYKKRGGSSLILWLYPYGGQKWNGVFVSSFGSINEAYATFLLHEQFNPTTIPEDNVETFMNGVLGVTNLRGSLQGDTTVGAMEAAIKSGGASTLSIDQLQSIANYIVNQKLNNLGAIQNYLREVKQHNREIQQPINKSYKEVLQNITDETLDQAFKSLSAIIGFA